jgi:hypothetical protein
MALLRKWRRRAASVLVHVSAQKNTNPLWDNVLLSSEIRPEHTLISGGLFMKKQSLAHLALLAASIIPASVAHATDVNVGINVGTPVVIAPPAPPAAIIVSPGWHGDRYWDGHRYWERDDWEKHHHHYKGWHCPPGHAKKGEC